MATFVALYRGRTISDAEIVAISADPGIVELLFEAILNEEPTRPETESGAAVAAPSKEVRSLLEAVPDGG